VTDDTRGTLALVALLMGAISVGAAIPWGYGVGLLVVGAVGWVLWGR
jgi:hypothetical protein